jgi:hypothetical protein
MIEAVIVLSTMLVFMGLIMWTRNSYAMKLDMQQGTRSNALYYASHGCSGGGASERGGTVQDSSPEAESAAKKSNVAGSAAASRIYNTAIAKMSGKADWRTVWDANAGKGSLDLKKQGLSRTIEANSKVTCNEPAYDGGWKDWFQFGAQYLSGGMSGAGGLFK